MTRQHKYHCTIESKHENVCDTVSVKRRTCMFSFIQVSGVFFQISDKTLS